MWIRQLLPMLVLAAIVLTGCGGRASGNAGGADGTEPPISAGSPEATPSQTNNKPLDASYMQGEYWETVSGSADLLPLDADETPADYFEKIRQQAEAETERYLAETVLPGLEAFQEEYGGTKTEDTFYQDIRMDNLEPAGVFCRDGARYLVYILDYSARPASGTQLFLAGGMDVDNDGWMNPGPGHILALSFGDDESIRLAFGYQYDILPDDGNQELFQQDFSNMLAQYQSAQRVGG